MSRKIGLVVILIVAALLLYSLGQQIYNSLNASKRLDQEAAQLAQIKRQNQDLKNQANQANSWQFVEAQARNKLGFSRAGETVVVISQDELSQALVQKKPEEVKSPNWQGWLGLFLQ